MSEKRGEVLAMSDQRDTKIISALIPTQYMYIKYTFMEVRMFLSELVYICDVTHSLLSIATHTPGTTVTHFTEALCPYKHQTGEIFYYTDCACSHWVYAVGWGNCFLSKSRSFPYVWYHTLRINWSVLHTQFLDLHALLKSIFGISVYVNVKCKVWTYLFRQWVIFECGKWTHH